MHWEWPIRLQLDGTYHNLGMFFDRVSKFSRIINISDVVIRAKEPPELNLTITRNVPPRPSSYSTCRRRRRRPRHSEATMRSRAVERRVVLALLIGGVGLPDVLVARPSVQPPPTPEAAAAVIETVEQPELYSYDSEDGATRS